MRFKSSELEYGCTDYQSVDMHLAGHIPGATVPSAGICASEKHQGVRCEKTALKHPSSRVGVSDVSVDIEGPGTIAHINVFPISVGLVSGNRISSVVDLWCAFFDMLLAFILVELLSAQVLVPSCQQEQG
jgi:hypothetical protein